MTRLPIRLPESLTSAVTPARALVVGAVVVGTFLLTWVTAWALVGDGVPRGTRVLDVEIGGMSRDAAAHTLRDSLADKASAPLTVSAVDHERSLPPEKLGLTFDAEATVASAADRPLDPFALVSMLFGDQRVAPVASVDEPELTKAVAALAAEVDGKPRNGGVRFADGVAKAVEPRAGEGVDVKAARRTLRDAYLHTQQVTLPTTTQRPDVTQAEVQRAMKEFAEPAMSGPVVLEIAGEDLQLEPTDLDDHLVMEPDDEKGLVPRVKGKGLRKTLGSRLTDFEDAPRDASFRVDDGTPQVVPATLGKQAAPPDLAKAVLTALRSDSRRATLTLATKRPELTTEKAKNLGVDEQISSYTTSYPYAAYRLQNIHRAADLVDNTLLLPGETFSLNDAVGERTADNGFAKGTIIQDGRFFEDFGGGVSQLATTTFNAVFFAGLEDVEHQPHSFYISRYPEGREATVVWPVVDLAFRNDSPNGVLVDTSYTDSTVTVTLYGTKRYDIKTTKSKRYNIKKYDTVHDDSDTCVDQGGVEGFDIKVFRHFYSNGQKVRTETFRTHYNPADEIHCDPK